jgi:hypothetical protein
MDSDSFVPDNKKIFDLTEVYEERNGRNKQEVIVVDGRGYEKTTKDNNNINGLADAVESRLTSNGFHDEIIKRATEIAEKIAREIIPEIAERVIREEIEKLKKLNENGSPKIN